MTAAKNSSVSRIIDSRSASSNFGIGAAIGIDRSQVAKLEPLAGEVVDDRLGLGVASMRRTCLSSTSGDPERAVDRRLARARRRACCSRGNKTSGSPARSRRSTACRRASAGLPATFLPRESSSTRKRNSGETKMAWTASWMPRSKRSPFWIASSTSFTSFVELGRGDRPAVGAAGELFEDRPGHDTGRRPCVFGVLKMIRRCDSGSGSPGE